MSMAGLRWKPVGDDGNVVGWSDDDGYKVVVPAVDGGVVFGGDEAATVALRWCRDDVVQLCLWCVDSGCSKHMTGNLKLLINFVWKFLGAVRFGNDHVAAILGQFCDSDLEVAFRRNACFVRNLKGVDLLSRDCTTNLYTINLHDMASTSPICLMARASSTKSWLWHQRLFHLNFDNINDLPKHDLVSEFKNQVLKEYFDTVGISHQVSLVRTPQQNGVVERRNRTLVEAARTMLIFSRASLFLWAEAIATACFTQNCSIIHRRFNKTPYELINGRKPDISFLYVFGALCYPKNDHEDIRKLGAKGDIGFFIGYFADSCAFRVYNRRTKKIMETMNVSGLDLTYAPSTITTQQPTKDELDLLFKAMYNDYIGGQSSAAQRIDVDGLSLQQQQAQQQGTQASLQPETVADNVPNAMFDATTFVNPFTTSSISATESSYLQYVDPSNMYTFYQPYPYEFQWTKDHPLEQVIGEPSRPVLTRNQLRFDGDMCMYALTVSTMEPKNVKEAMTDPAWIESMQEELLQF
nr:hypothetical protein [Tanacetum cinerariifolium]